MWYLGFAWVSYVIQHNLFWNNLYLNKRIFFYIHRIKEKKSVLFGSHLFVCQGVTMWFLVLVQRCMMQNYLRFHCSNYKVGNNFDRDHFTSDNFRPFSRYIFPRCALEDISWKWSQIIIGKVTFPVQIITNLVIVHSGSKNSYIF